VRLERVRQTRAVVVAFGSEEDLRLMRQAPERLAVDDAVPVPLELGAQRVGFHGSLASARSIGKCSAG